MNEYFKYIDTDEFRFIQNIAKSFPNRVETFIRTEKKIGRNEPCKCGSGKKQKKCCKF